MTIHAVTDSRIADLKQTGKLRVALYPPQYARDQNGELRGWTIELGRALAERIGVEFVPVEYPTPPKAMEALKKGVCDVGFGAMEASRISEIDSHQQFFNSTSRIWCFPARRSRGSWTPTVQVCLSQWCRPCIHTVPEPHKQKCRVRHSRDARGSF